MGSVVVEQGRRARRPTPYIPTTPRHGHGWWGDSYVGCLILTRRTVPSAEDAIVRQEFRPLPVCSVQVRRGAGVGAIEGAAVCAVHSGAFRFAFLDVLMLTWCVYTRRTLAADHEKDTDAAQAPSTLPTPCPPRV